MKKALLTLSLVLVFVASIFGQMSSFIGDRESAIIPNVIKSQIEAGLNLLDKSVEYYNDGSYNLSLVWDAGGPLSEIGIVAIYSFGTDGLCTSVNQFVPVKDKNILKESIKEMTNKMEKYGYTKLEKGVYREYKGYLIIIHRIFEIEIYGIKGIYMMSRIKQIDDIDGGKLNFKDKLEKINKI